MRAYSLLSLGRALRIHEETGQVSTIAIILIVLSLFLATATMNLGEIARIKTATANAADAGALAGASWVASLNNEIATYSAAMWFMIGFLQLFWAAPFCWTVAGWMPASGWRQLLLALILFWGFLALLVKTLWDTSEKAAWSVAVQNVAIDDPTGKVERWLKDHEGYDGEIHWTRTGGDGVARDRWVQIGINRSNSPPIPAPIVWPIVWWSLFGPCAVLPCGPFCVWLCCFPIPEWQSVLRIPLYGLPIEIPMIGGCLTCPLIPSPEPWGLFPVMAPVALVNGENDFTVTVTEHRDSGARVGFWTMRYPKENIVSQATAHYTTTPIMGPVPIRSSRAELTHTPL